jgi:hypothetical protein
LVNANIKATLKAMKIKGYDGGRRRQPSTAFRLY